jgi:hypothetical protein
VGKNRYTKILSHLKSQEIDQKINYLNERMTTTGLYVTYGLDSGTPAVPEIPAIPTVPPTYENVTGGLSNPNDFVWGDQGDGSDPDAPANIPANLYTTYNGEQVAAVRQIEGEYPEGVTPLGYVLGFSWLSTYPVGYLTGNGINFIASAGVFANASTDLGRAYQQAFNNWPFPGKIEKTIYFWGSLDCLFGTCRGASQYYPSNLSNTSTPKADYALYSYTLWLAADANGNPLPNRIMTDPGVPEVPAIPGTPAIPPQVIISRSNLGDPNYYPGFIKSLVGFAENVGKAISDFGKGAEQAITQIGNKIREGEKSLSNFTKPITRITDGIEDGINLLSNVKNILGSTQWGPKDSGGRYTLPPGSLGTQNNPLSNKLSSSTQEYLLQGYDPKIDGSLGQHLQRKTSINPNIGGNFGAKGTHNNITGTPYIDNKGNIRIPDTYGFGPSEDIANKQIVKQTVNFFGAVADALGGEKAKQEVSANIQTFFDQSGFGFIPGTPGKEAPIVHFETVIPASQAQKLSPNYRNQPVKEESLFEKFKRQNQSNQTVNEVNEVSEYDLLIQEIQNLPSPIKKYLLLEFETSMKLATLSPSERQFKEKEIQNELLVKTSDLYIDTHFPENKKLFNRLQQSIKRNIKLTDPKTFKNVIDTPSFKKLLSVDYVNKTELPKKKIKLQNRNKKTAARYIKKPRIKSAMELTDAKIIELDREMKKTGMST